MRYLDRWIHDQTLSWAPQAVSELDILNDRKKRLGETAALPEGLKPEKEGMGGDIVEGNRSCCIKVIHEQGEQQVEEAGVLRFPAYVPPSKPFSRMPLSCSGQLAS
jgi:hypothetical protein